MTIHLSQQHADALFNVLARVEDELLDEPHLAGPGELDAVLAALTQLQRRQEQLMPDWPKVRHKGGMKIVQPGPEPFFFSPPH